MKSLTSRLPISLKVHCDGWPGPEGGHAMTFKNTWEGGLRVSPRIMSKVDKKTHYWVSTI